MAAKVIVFTVSRRPFMWGYAAENVLRQSLKPDLALLAIHGLWSGHDAFTKPIHAAGIPVMVMFVDSHVLAGELTNRATGQAANYEPEALVVKMDDDDWYGENYCAEMASFWSTHPDAWVMGKSSFTIRYVGGAKDGRTESDAGRINDEAGHATALAGPTFSIPARHWLLTPTFRYPNIGLGCDGALLQQLDHLLTARGVPPPMPIYHVESAEFELRRYLNPWHGHHWNRPQDYA